MAYTSSIVQQARVVTAKRTAMRTSKWLPLWFLLPSIAILLALQVGPSLYSLYLSTTQIDPNTGQNINVGLSNFVYLFNSPTFRESLWHTVVYSVSFITLTISLGLMLALLLNRRIKFTGFYLVLIFLPWVISDVVAGTMWRWMFQQTYGIVQVFLNPIVGSSLYTNATGAMAIVVAASVWRSLAFTTLLFLAALQTVPNEVLESAALDGANRVQRFLSIIFPLIRSAFLVTVLLTSIRAINSVGLIFSITRGNPGGATQTASYYLLRYGWEQGDIGQGAAVSVILFAINIVLTVIYIRWVGVNRE
jgi:ABC-type sugar transport system permease subunit